MEQPNDQTLAAYVQGTLDGPTFAQVDAWVSVQSEADQERLFEQFATETITTKRDLGPQNDLVFTSTTGRRFTAGDELGRGGMGVVSGIHDRALDRGLALKVCRPRDFDENPEHYLLRRSRFEREVAILAQLDHPGITPIYDVGYTADGRPAYTMKRLEGVDLAAYRDEHDESPRFWGELILRVAETMAFAHSRGIVHRDLKPSNIVVGPYGSVTVVDWGLATGVNEAVEPAGTPSWMAPEQAHAATATAAMDIWGLGALLGFCLDGQTPSDRLTDLPNGLGYIADKALAEAAEKRFPSMDALVESLRHWLDFGAAHGEPLGPMRRAGVYVRKNPRSAAIAAAMLAIVLSTSLVWLLQLDAHRAEVHQERLAEIDRLITGLDLGDADALQSATARLAAMPGELREEQAFVSAMERIITAQDILAREQRTVEQRRLFDEVLWRYHHGGPWSGEVKDRLAVLKVLGFPDDLAEQVTFVSKHALKSAMMRNLLHALVAARLDRHYGIHGSEPIEQLSQLLEILGEDDPSLAAAVVLLKGARLGPHEPELWDHHIRAHLPALVQDAELLDMVLSVVAPDEKLVAAATDRVGTEPNAYWPQIFLARMALIRERPVLVREHALVAHGRYPHCYWPALLLAYADLYEGRDEQGLAWARKALRASPDNLEAGVVTAALEARTGHRKPAEELVADPTIAAHIRYHLVHPHGHPMEFPCEVLNELGIQLPDVEPKLGPIFKH